MIPMVPPLPSVKSRNGSRKGMVVSRPYRILIADDHAVVRHGVRALLESQPGIEVCGEAVNGREAVEFVEQNRPNLVILDVAMPEMDVVEVIGAIREASPETEILVFTIHGSEDLARRVLTAGAMGYVLKTDADSELLSALDHVRHHQPFFTSKLDVTMSQDVIRHQSARADTTGQIVATVPPLTPREIEVVRLLANGKSNREAAGTLEVSTRTVESHRDHIMHKLHFSSFSQLVRFAVRTKLVEP
jgi:DNA-binding NarL/FixJ family response regulator